ncbi:RHS repeat-associated core domain-containing protein, partial [Betaproteobacteria bacterium PRO4]|nr:RHS repeat-associated core domain-containing protein [Betaproteobacteria bacterium PRO4]
NETNQPQLMIIWSNQPKTVYFLKDHLGSIRATVLDSAGAPVVAYDDYDPWGYLLAGRTKKRTWSDSQAVARNKFTGKEWDDDYGVNWLHFPYRSYDPEIGRWMVRDPLAMKYPSWSPYNYVLNNPVRLFDPDGKQVDVHEARFLRDQALRNEGVDLAPFHQADAKVDLIGAGILAGGLTMGAAGPSVTAGVLANPLTVNKIGIGIAEALAPGAEHLGVGQAVSAFKSFDFGSLAKKVGIEGIGGADLQRTVGGILAKSVKGSDLGTVLNALDEPLSSGGISMTGIKSMVGGKLIEFIPDGKGNVTITVRELGKDSSKLIGSSTVKASDLPFKDLGIDLSDSSLNKHFIGEVK